MTDGTHYVMRATGRRWWIGNTGLKCIKRSVSRGVFQEKCIKRSVSREGFQKASNSAHFGNQIVHKQSATLCKLFIELGDLLNSAIY